MTTRLSAGIVPLRRVPGGWRLLLLRAFRNWDFPKGLVEPGEDPKAAAVRETAEEAGISDLDFAFGDGYRETAPYAGGKIARYYLAVTRQERVTLPVSEALGKPEHHEYRWADVTEAGELLPARLQPVLEWARKTIEVC
jgi:8-oxo-dGTP pyrophosphatase MutT (NUDIX family)